MRQWGSSGSFFSGEYARWKRGLGFSLIKHDQRSMAFQSLEARRNHRFGRRAATKQIFSVDRTLFDG